MTRAGKYDRRIEVFRNLETLDDNRAVIQTEMNVTPGGIFAQRLIDNSVEDLQPGQIQNRRFVTFETYYWTGKIIQPQDWIVFENERYDVVDIQEIGRRDAMRIKAVRR